MAWRIGENIVRGEIDNRLPGIIQGTLYVEGLPEPLALELEGNCDPDLAGRRLTFCNLRPCPPLASSNGLGARQCGEAGTMTANRMLRIPTIPDDEVQRYVREHIAIPTRWSESLHLEWFGADGRVLVEGSSFRCELTPPSWILTAEAHRWAQRSKEMDRWNSWEEEDVPLLVDDELAIGALAPRPWRGLDGLVFQPHPMVRRLSEFVLYIVGESQSRRIFVEDRIVNHALESMIDSTVEAWIRLTRALAGRAETAVPLELRRIAAGLKQARWSLGQASENAAWAANMGAADSNWLKSLRREFTAMRNELQTLIHGAQEALPKGSPGPAASPIEASRDEAGGRHE